MTNTLGINTVILDADALIGIIHDDDALHIRCLEISSFLTKNNINSIVPYPIVLEEATSLSRNKNMSISSLAVQLLSDFADIKQDKDFTYDVSGIVADLYNPSTSKKNTPFDHYILALAKKNNIKYVFSFDTFYEKNGLTLAEELLK